MFRYHPTFKFIQLHKKLTGKVLKFRNMLQFKLYYLQMPSRMVKICIV